MKCSCCNKTLTDFEATRKHAITGEYLDTCNKCIVDLDIPTQDRVDLLSEGDCHESDNEGLDRIDDMTYNNTIEENIEDNC